MKKIILIIFVALSIFSCSKKQKESKSIDQLRKEEGIPVSVEAIKNDTLINWATYYSQLKGKNEINVIPFVGDRLVKIFVKEGDYVKKGALIAQFAKDNPATITARQTKIQYKTIKQTYLRMKNVYENGGISKQKLDEVKMQYDIAKEAYLSTSKMINVVAPISGVVTDIYADKYKMLDPKKDAICKIATVKKLRTKIFIDEDEIAKYKKGQKVEIKWSGLPAETFYGKISKIAYSSTPMAHGFSATVLINNKKKKLMPGLNVNVKIRTVFKPNVIIVPQNTILDENGKSFVYIENNGKAKKVEVEKGKISSSNIEIIKGLSLGDRLITKGLMLLDDGMKIKLISKK